MKEQAARVCAMEGSDIFSDNSLQRLLAFFMALHCMPDKERGPARIVQAQKPAIITVIEQTG